MAKDIIHHAVREALENEGFIIQEDPFKVKLIDDDTSIFIDLSAQLFLQNNRKTEKIVALEVKSFAGISVLNAFHEALGQYLNYKAAIKENNLKIKLFLAVSEDAWLKLNSLNFVRRRILQYRLKFVVIDIYSKSVLKWIN